MSRDDREYFERRAEAELKRAQEAENPAAVHAHSMLAELHLERAGKGAIRRIGSKAGGQQ